MKQLLYKPLNERLLLISRKKSIISSGNAPRSYFKHLTFAVLFFIALFSNRISYGQAAENTDWQLLKESEGVQAYYMIYNCSSENLIHFKIKNNNAVEKKIIWMASIRSNDKVFTGIPTSAPKAFKTGEELSSDCNNKSQLLTMQLHDGFKISDLQFNLIILP